MLAADTAREHDWVFGFFGDTPVDPYYRERCAEYGADWAAFRVTPGRPYRAWVQLSRWLCRVRPEALILHSITAILPCRWYASRHRARLLTVEHTPNAVKRRTERMASRLSMLLADKVVVLTPEYRNELAVAYGCLFRAEKVATVPNGIDTARFSPAQGADRASTSVVRIGMAARFSFSKRQDLLIGMLERLTEMRPDLAVELSLIGDGTELARIRTLAEKSLVASKIRFEGLLSENKVADWMRSLDLYVHASEGETLSTSLLQAMATALPIVASDIPGVRNLLEGTNRFGLCVANEEESFARAVEGLLSDRQSAQVSADRARARVVDSYSHRVMLQRYLQLLRPAV